MGSAHIHYPARRANKRQSLKSEDDPSIAVVLFFSYSPADRPLNFGSPQEKGPGLCHILSKMLFYQELTQKQTQMQKASENLGTPVHYYQFLHRILP
ncbi:hypothetical protein SUGI_0587710 [Cryptomeria japonica]|nr:hypothetical protein SUGI_0587710 [Cryptomeria japonica]